MLQYQIAQQQQQQAADLSDKQIAAQKEIADQQAALNQKQFDAQQAEYQQQQQQVQDQATRQSAYDSGRADLLSQGAQQVSDAFSQFTPDYFNKYAQDYMSKAQDQIDYQKQQAVKDLAFATARQGIPDSQAQVNQTGLIAETAGRATAEQTANAQSAAAQLQANTAAAKQGLLGQVQASESIGSPIAGSTIEDVNNALQTQRTAVSGIASNAGDTASSFTAVPQVSTLGTLFGGVLGAGGNLLQGANANTIMGAFKAGAAGSPAAGSPSGSSTTIR